MSVNEITRSLQESLNQDLQYFDNPYQDYFWYTDQQNQYVPLHHVPPYYRMNRKDGEMIPVYLNEWGLRVIRDNARILAEENEYGISAIENLGNYVVGDGAQYTSDDPQVQDYIQAWARYVGLAELELETVQLSAVDGERFHRLFPNVNNYPDIRVVEPEHIHHPGGSTTGPNSFGIYTRENDPESVLGYWVVSDPSLGFTEAELVEEQYICHYKVNTPRPVKRGLSTFYPVINTLRECEKVQKGMSSITQARAKVAMLIQMAAFSGEAAQTFSERLTGRSVTDPGTQNTYSIDQLPFGAVIRTNDKTKYEFPTAQIGAGDYIEVMQALLRAVAVAFQMPEWMLTAWNDQKFSNALVAEAPTMKAFQKHQRRLAHYFALGQANGRKSMLQKVVALAVIDGILPASALQASIKCEFPTLEVRDPQVESQRLVMLSKEKIISRPEAQRSLGYDPELQDDEMKNDPMAVQEQTPGAPGIGAPMPQGPTPDNGSEVIWSQVDSHLDDLDGKIQEGWEYNVVKSGVHKGQFMHKNTDTGVNYEEKPGERQPTLTPTDLKILKAEWERISELITELYTAMKRGEEVTHDEYINKFQGVGLSQPCCSAMINRVYGRLMESWRSGYTATGQPAWISGKMKVTKESPKGRDITRTMFTNNNTKGGEQRLGDPLTPEDQAYALFMNSPYLNVTQYRDILNNLDAMTEEQLKALLARLYKQDPRTQYKMPDRYKLPDFEKKKPDLSLPATYRPALSADEQKAVAYLASSHEVFNTKLRRGRNLNTAEKAVHALLRSAFDKVHPGDDLNLYISVPVDVRATKKTIQLGNHAKKTDVTLGGWVVASTQQPAEGRYITLVTTQGIDLTPYGGEGLVALDYELTFTTSKHEPLTLRQANEYTA